MPAVPTRELVAAAFAAGYAVPAINVVNDLTMEAVLAAADESRAPLIVQTSVKTVQSMGVEVLAGLWRPMAARVSAPVSLHLDHCPDRRLISLCLAAGWSSVLFDGSALPVEENLRQCREVVAEAGRHDADVEGEIEGIPRVEEGGAVAGPDAQSLEVAVDFVRRSGVAIFAPAIGNAHGLYTEVPVLDHQRVSDIVAATGLPQALHGGTGLRPEQFSDLIARGCAKVNVSTALKIAYLEATRQYLVERPQAADPPKLFDVQRAAVMEVARVHIRLFGAEGRA